jgi:hypothetical protein
VQGVLLELVGTRINKTSSAKADTEDQDVDEDAEGDEEDCVYIAQASLRHRLDFELTVALPLGNAWPGLYRYSHIQPNPQLLTLAEN